VADLYVNLIAMYPTVSTRALVGVQKQQSPQKTPSTRSNVIEVRRKRRMIRGKKT
jgi:hypothetical protein